MVNPNRVIRFIKIRGKIIPITKSSMPKIMYHQTTEEASKIIKKSGFNSKILGSRKSDTLPDGIYLKSSSRDIGLQGKEQIPVLVSKKKTKFFQHREDFNDFMVKKSEKIKALLGKEKKLDDVMSKKTDRLLEKQRKLYRGANKNIERGRLFKGKTDKHFYRWRKLGNEISGNVRKEANFVLESEGYDSVALLNDQGSFGRKTDTLIVFDDKKVTPLKKLLKIRGNKKW